jgi:hypothetical protein
MQVVGRLQVTDTGHFYLGRVNNTMNQPSMKNYERNDFEPQSGQSWNKFLESTCIRHV